MTAATGTDDKTTPAGDRAESRGAAAGPRRTPAWVLFAAGTAAGVGFGLVGPGLPMGAPLVLMGLGGLVLVWCGLTFWRVVDPLLRGGADHVEVDRPAPVRRRELEREKQLVLKAIREIELDYQMRKISESDYKEMTQRYRTRALRLLRELDAGEDYRSLIEQELKARLQAAEAAGGREKGG